jgi:hypothetical protein
MAQTEWSFDNFVKYSVRRGCSVFLVHPSTKEAFLIQYHNGLFYFGTPDGVPESKLLRRLRKIGSFRPTKTSPHGCACWRIPDAVHPAREVFVMCNWLIETYGHCWIWGTADHADWRRELDIARDCV